MYRKRFEGSLPEHLRRAAEPGGCKGYEMQKFSATSWLPAKQACDAKTIPTNFMATSLWLLAIAPNDAETFFANLTFVCKLFNPNPSKKLKTGAHVGKCMSNMPNNAKAPPKVFSPSGMLFFDPYSFIRKLPRKGRAAARLRYRRWRTRTDGSAPQNIPPALPLY